VRAAWLFVPLSVYALWACGSSKNAATAGDAGASDAGDDGGEPCDTTGVSKGPWVLHVDGSSAVVRWEACRKGTPPGVSYTPESGGAEKHADATETPFVVTSTIKVLDSDAPPDWAGTWYMHEAQLTGLAPATCYRYGLDADPTIAARFCTARNPGDTIKFLAIGDTNPALGFSTRDVMKHVAPLAGAPAADDFDFTVHGGDIEYYSSFVETYAYWFELMPPLLRQGAFLPAVGNHDGDDQSGEPMDKFQQYTDRFWGGAGFGGTDEYYGFSTGGVSFFTLDTEDPIDPSSVQYQWLANQLQQASAQPGYRFSILFLHRPFMTCGDTGDDTSDLAQMQTLFTKYKVPLVIQAHMHGYERFEIPGLTLVTAGGGGGALGDVNANTSRSYCSERVASGAFFHAELFEIAPGTISCTVVDDQGNVRDSFSHAVP
jgi:hypothetical protein